MVEEIKEEEATYRKIPADEKKIIHEYIIFVSFETKLHFNLLFQFFLFYLFSRFTFENNHMRDQKVEPISSPYIYVHQMSIRFRSHFIDENLK